MLAWGIPLLFPNENTRKYFLSVAAISFLIIMSVSTWKQCGYWKNSTTLSKHTIQATKNNFVAHKCLADALLTEGKNEEAIYHYSEAIRIYPDFANAYNNRGNAYFNQDNQISGCKDAKKACELGTCIMLEAAKGKGLCH